jgi:hypothetical protein
MTHSAAALHQILIADSSEVEIVVVIAIAAAAAALISLPTSSVQAISK